MTPQHLRAGGIVVGLLCAIAVFSATPASAATWTGTTHGKLLRSDTMLSGGASWRGDFWFTTDREGRVRGQAVVAYEPSADLAGLNAALGYVRDVAAGAIGLLAPPWGSVVATVGPTAIVGTNVRFHKAVAIHRGRISGLLHRGRLTLELAKEPDAIPYDINLRLATGNERLDGGSFTPPNPFDKAGDVTNGRHAVSSSQSSTTPGGVTELVGSYWVAHRMS